MNARAEDFLEPDFENGTSKAGIPTTVQLMNGVYKRNVQHRSLIDVITDTPSGDIPPGMSADYTTAGISPAEPDARKFGSWLERYMDQLQPSFEKYYDACSLLWSGSKLGILDERYLLARRTSKNKAAIDLLQSWIDEDPDDQQAADLIRLKEAIDEQRADDRKLFT